jgi:glycosyltransferase involved in cell wall biosynthesis
MNILLVNHYAGSLKHGMEYRPFYLAREWVRLGHSTTIVAASVSHVRSIPPAMRGQITEEDIDGIRYVWLRTPSYEGNGVRRALNMFSFVGRLLAQRTRVVGPWHPDVVVASSTYPLDILPASVIARAHGARLVFEVHDLWPLTPIELGGMSRSHPFILLLQWAEDFAYRRADVVVSMLPKAKDYMVARGMAAHKFVHVPNGVDPETLAGENGPLPTHHREVLDELRAKGQFVVGYAGAHGLANSLGTLIGALERIQDQPVTVVLVGQGPEKERLSERARRLRPEAFRFLPPVPRSAMPSLLARMDALFIGLKRSPLFRFGISPNKLMDYMAAGKPVIQAIDAGNDIVAESKCGLSVLPEDPIALAAAIRRLMDIPQEERTAMGARGKDYVTAHHDYRKLARHFIDVVN